MPDDQFFYNPESVVDMITELNRVWPWSHWPIPLANNLCMDMEAHNVSYQIITWQFNL